MEKDEQTTNRKPNTHNHVPKHNFVKRTELYEDQILLKLQQLQQKKQDKSSSGTTSNIRKAEAETFEYSKIRIQNRKNNYGLVDTWYKLITTQYERISFLLCEKTAQIDDEAIQLISDVFYPIKMFPDLVLDIVNLFDNPSQEIVDLLESPDLIAPSLDLVRKSFIYDPVTNQVLNAVNRYLINMKGMEVRKYLDNRVDSEFNIRINSELFLQLSNQSRWNNIWIQIAVSLFYMDSVSEAKALQNLSLPTRSTRRFGTDLITFRTIAYILKQWESLPFRVRQDGILDIDYHNDKWTTSQIPLLYSLLELSKEERGFNVNAEFCDVIVKYRIRAAFTSFETYTLDHKGIYSKMLKLISSKIEKYARYTFSRDFSNQQLSLYEGNVEVYVHQNELKDLLTEVSEKCDPDFLQIFNRYLNLLNDGTHTQNTELARWLSGILLTMGNAGIYYKTSLVLEKEKSVASQTLGTLNFPKPASLWVFNDVKLDLETNWDSGDYMYNEINKRYKQDILPYLNDFNVVNLQEWFYTLLTNRSQGFKVDVAQFSNRMGIDPLLLNDLKNVGQVRVASFLLDNEVFSVFGKYSDSLQHDGVCTIRFQNNRRARIVEIVPNVDQIGYALVLKVFEELKADYEQIAVGKQIGGINDMKLQLRISGLQNGVSIFSDVSAMDAHTQPNVAVMFLKMLAESIILNDIGPLNYFPFKTSDCVVQFTKYSQNYPNVLQNRKKIPSLAKTLLYIASQRLNKKYLLKDKIFNCTIEINPTIFESGRFDTSAQHTTLLKYSADVVYEKLKTMMPTCLGKYIAVQRKFGDDSYEALELNGLNDQEKDEMIQTIIKLTNESLYQVGLKSETELSAYYGDFLQQMSFCGVVIPKSARSSIYTDEKGALVNRDMVDLITNLTNIITASAQRCYAPDNVISIVRNIWACNRLFRLLPSKQLAISKEFNQYVKKFGPNHYLEYPYIMITLPPLNFPNQNFVFNTDHGQLVYPAVSSLRTVGLCKLNYIWNEVIPLNIRDTLFTTESNNVDVFKMIDVAKVFIDTLKGTNIVESLVFMSFKRSQELSRMRYEKLKDPITKMANVAKNYFNQSMLRASVTAAVHLKSTYGITVPDSLLYYMKPIEQLKDMFQTRGETLHESFGLNDAYISQMSKDLHRIPKKIIDSIVNTCVFWIRTKIPVYKNVEEICTLPLLPGYSMGSDYFNALQLIGNALRTQQRTNRALVTFTNRYGGSYNLEAIHRIGMQAKLAGSSKSTNAFELFLTAMQLPPRIRAAVEEMFTNDDTVLLSDLYSSGFQPEQMFIISDSLNNLSSYLDFSNITDLKNKSTIAVILRDYMLLTCSWNEFNHKLQPLMPPMTFMRYNARALLSRVGIVGL